jgi:hypothetical protein
VKPISTLSKAAAQRLPCRIHALSYGDDVNPVIPTEFPAGPAPEAPRTSNGGTTPPPPSAASHPRMRRSSSSRCGRCSICWRRLHYQVDAEVTFLLTSGGHNKGIVAPPSEQEHSYQVNQSGGCPLCRPGGMGEKCAACRRFVVAGMDQVADRAVRRTVRAAARGCRLRRGESLPDAPGDYVRQ